MRRITIKEQQKFLDGFAHQLHSAGMISADDLCYGSVESFTKSDKEYKLLIKLIDYIPKDILKAYNKSLDKRRADKLRKQADAIEAGKASDQ